MYERTIKVLNEKGISLDVGLSEEEIDKLRELYCMDFPTPLKQFLQTVLPVSNGFYNWRDFSDDNITFIKKIMKYPFDTIYSMPEEVYWNDEWGNEPENEDERVKRVQEKLLEAPKLIPIYSHRYMPLCELTKYPIISVHGVDIIYYGESLSDYIEIEFGNKKQMSLDYSTIEHVPFWSELM